MALSDTLKELVVGSYSFVNKKGQRYFLHMREGRGGTQLYYFSKDPKDALSLPKDKEVVESTKTGLPIVRKRKY